MPAWIVIDEGVAYVATQYLLETGDDHPDRDPYAWHFEGTNDMIDWVTLHSELAYTGWTARRQTQIFSVANNTSPFRYYRINILQTYGGGSGDGTACQLTEAKVICPVSDFCPRGTATGSNDGVCAGSCASQAVDGSQATKWYSATMPAWIVVNEGEFSIATSYTIESGEDFPDRDPYSWEFQGSVDGSNWVTLHSMKGYTGFTERHMTKTFHFDNSQSYRLYRTSVSQTFGSGSGEGTACQMTEIKVVCPSPADACPLGAATGSNDGVCADQCAAQAVDGRQDTKFYSAVMPAWMVIDEGPGALVATSYTLESGPDFADRNPYTWTLTGSLDDVTYTRLHSVTAYVGFTAPHQTQTFNFQNSRPFRYYRLDVAQTYGQGGGDGSAFQVTEVKIICPQTGGRFVAEADPAEGDAADTTTGWASVLALW